MNREITFRAWDKIRKEMTSIMEITWAPDDRIFTVTVVKDIDAPVYVLGPEEVELMQYTGLKDKNGKEIYEGDIVRFKLQTGFACGWEDGTDFDPTGAREIIRVVRYQNGEFVPRDEANIVEDGYYSWKTFDFEIIGNQFENPSLLTKKSDE